MIRKQLGGAAAGGSEVFGFDGNLSFNEGGVFSLQPKNGQAASQTFYRAAGAEPWRVRELVPDGWRLTSLDCQQAGASQVTTDLAAAGASIVLAPGDTVVCTFTDEPQPTVGDLFIRKVTEGGVGLFDFRVLPLDGDGPGGQATARTEEEDVPVDAEPSPIELAPGDYRVRERMPRVRGGRWQLVGATCNAQPLRLRGGRTPRLRPEASVNVRIAAGEGAACTFRNRFVPRGAIAIAKQTYGATGTAGFEVSPTDDPATVFEQAATTTAIGVPALARGDRTRRLPLGEYVIQELDPHSGDGDWALRQVLCNGQLVPATGGRVTVRLTRAEPRLRCLFTNVFSGTTPPPPVDPPGPNVVPGGPGPDLAISKHADRRVAGLGERVTFTVVVRNRGPVAAENVIVVDRPGKGLTLVRNDPRCGARGRLIGCRIASIPAGESVRLSFVMRIDAPAPATVRNVAVVGSDTAEATVRDNLAVAGVSARRLVCVPGRGFVEAGLAHAAC